MTKTRINLDLSQRPRRLRNTQAMRDLVADVNLQAKNFISPYFVVSGQHQTQPIGALPGVSRFSVDTLIPEIERALKLGIKAVMLFGVIEAAQKSADGKASQDTAGPVASALRELRLQFGNDLVLMTDICLCGYTDHGHCGVLKNTARGIVIDNDQSLMHLAAMARLHAEAGADVVSPSDMMDSRVAAIRQTLDAEGFSEVSILSYAVKYASAFYGPFREAAGSSPQRVSPRHEGMMLRSEAKLPPADGSANGMVRPADGSANGIIRPADGSANGMIPPNNGMIPPKDRKTYQMDFRHSASAMREIELDTKEGADMLMVKPALAYLDVIAKVKANTHLPVVAYNVSGEYAMIKAAAGVGALDEGLAVAESLLAMRRAGADLIISYHAVEALEKGWLA